MMNFLINRFETKTKNKPDLRAAFGVFAGRIGLLSNLILFISTLVIGLISGSVSIMADAMNNLSDTISSILTLVGFYISGKPADKEHPYGHERFEYISGMLVSLMVTFVGFQFLRTSFERIKDPQSIKVTPIVLLVLLLSIFIKIWQGLFYKKVAKKIDSSTLIATAKDSMNDVYTTIAVLFSAGIEGLTGWEIDGYVGFVIACYIIYVGIQLIREFINELMGLRPNQEAIDKMRKYLSEVPNIVGFHDLLIHQYGPNKTFASVHIEIDDRWDLNRAHKTIDDIEKKFQEQLGVDLVCHIDPVNLYDQVQQDIYHQVKKVVKSLSQELRPHDIRLVDIGESEEIHFDLVVPTDFYLTDQEIFVIVQEYICQNVGQYKIRIIFDHTYLL